MLNYRSSISPGKLIISSFTLVLITAIPSLLSVQNAEAQTRAAICRSLSAQLASLPSGSSGGNAAEFRKYDQAVRQQAAQVKKTQSIARRSRCTGFGIFNSKSAQCNRVMSTLRKMEANLQQLSRKRSQAAPSGANNNRIRQRIIKDMQRNRCSSKQTELRDAKASEQTKPARKTIVEQVFGSKTYNERGQRTDSGNNGQILSIRGGTYRTLCVRKTDGYYFPISFSTTKDHFDRDEATCQAMCPKADVALYHHKMPSEDSEEMVSFATGKPYSSESFAFAYRKSIDINNRCRFAQDTLKTVEVATEKKKQNASSQTIGTPAFREDPAFSPDDHDIAHGKLTFAKAKGYLRDYNSDEDDQGNEILADNRNVRIVGPAFFPVQ